MTALIRRISQQGYLRTPLWASLVIAKLDQCHSDSEFDHTLLSLPETAEVFIQELADTFSQAKLSRRLESLPRLIGILVYPVHMRSLLDTMKDSPLFRLRQEPHRFEQHPLFPHCGGILHVDAKAQLRYTHELGFQILHDSETAQRTTFSIGSSHGTISFMFSLGSMVIEPEEWQRLATLPRYSNDLKLYCFKNFPYHFAKVESGEAVLLSRLHKFLERNMLCWVGFLSNLGSGALDHATSHLDVFCRRCAKQKLSEDGEKALRFLVMFLSSRPRTSKKTAKPSD